MKLIIDINDEVYQHMMGKDLLQSVHGKICYKAVQNGTPIPDNATVCDIEQIRAEIASLPTNNVSRKFAFDVIDKYRIVQIIDKYR